MGASRGDEKEERKRTRDEDAHYHDERRKHRGRDDRHDRGDRHSSRERVDSRSHHSSRDPYDRRRSSHPPDSRTRDRHDHKDRRSPLEHLDSRDRHRSRDGSDNQNGRDKEADRRRDGENDEHSYRHGSRAHSPDRDAKADGVRDRIKSEEEASVDDAFVSQFLGEEDDEREAERIKERSRKRRQAIIESYKAQQPLPAPEQATPVADTTMGNGSSAPQDEEVYEPVDDDIFGESPSGDRKRVKGDGFALESSGLIDNWDDAEGYYTSRVGEVLDTRYEVSSSLGKGVFSTVVRAWDLKRGPDDPEEVAIKIIRNNETMFKAGQTELVILKKLAGADPENRRHCVRLLSSFKFRSHLCMVFESLHMNLREVLKKFGRNIGINLSAVRAYATQLFIALKHLRNCGVLHCDIKPDNMLVNEAKNLLKLADFGSAMFAGENEITPYLVSRFYRAPEIMLGLPYDHALDMWSVGCCLYELHTGKMLFPGRTNNDMLRLQMELKGLFPKKLLKKATLVEQHFDQDFNFCALEEDPVTSKLIKRIISHVKPKDMGVLVGIGSSEEDAKLLMHFKDLLEKIFILDPDKRLTVSDALKHPFVTSK
eukprot:SM000017S02778  [mRNA]  locus=s17:193456:197059:+ [translate_table: standard]